MDPVDDRRFEAIKGTLAAVFKEFEHDEGVRLSVGEVQQALFRLRGALGIVRYKAERHKLGLELERLTQQRNAVLARLGEMDQLN